MASSSGLSTKTVCLAILVVQNSALTLMMRYSQTTPGPRYLSSTAVVLAEVVKCLICLLMYFRQEDCAFDRLQLQIGPTGPVLQPRNNFRYAMKQVWIDLFSERSGFIKLLVPASFYALQNNLQFKAASELDAATFQVTYQGKILTTAVLSVMVLGRSLAFQQWIALLILTLGVALVQLPTSPMTISKHQQNTSSGFLAVGVACMCSGFAAVYFERVLKGGQPVSIWVRNIQLSVGCMGFALTGTLLWDFEAIREHGFFQGYNLFVLATIGVQAAGGLIVAMVVKQADNILKSFATSLSIILSVLISIPVFGLQPSNFFLIGTVCVLAATYLYSVPQPPIISDAARSICSLCVEKQSMLSCEKSEMRPIVLEHQCPGC